MRMYRPAASLILLAPLAFVACKRPEVEAFRNAPPPLVVAFKAQDSGKDGEAVSQEYAAALRARLANRTTVVAERTPPPTPHVTLEIQVDRRETRRGGRPNAAQVGVATGVIVGTLSAIAGDRDAFATGLWWGIWAGVNTASHNRHERRWWRDVVPPNLVQGQVRLMQPGLDEPLYVFTVEPEEVLDAMDPLRNADKEDPQRVREEEAKGFARVVVSRMSEKFHWPLRRDASWYRGPGREEGPESRPDQPAPKQDGPRQEPDRH